MRNRPSIYPNSLPWYNGPTFETPADVKSDIWSLLIGSSLPVFHCSEYDILAQEFDWCNSPSSQQLVRHFKNVVEAYTNAEKPVYMKIVTDMYNEFQKTTYTVIRNELDNEDLDKWVWNGDGFSKPEYVVNNNPFLDTHPYLYTLPMEVKQHNNMLKNLAY